MQQAGMAVISGVDPRDGVEYVNQMFIGLSGGPGLNGHDGWLTYEGPDGGAMIVLDTIEIIEAMYPILVEGRWVERDTLGPGEWDGAPGTTGIYGPVAGEMTVIYCSDGEQIPRKVFSVGCQPPRRPIGSGLRTERDGVFPHSTRKFLSLERLFCSRRVGAVATGIR